MITRLGLHPDEKKILSGREEDCLAVASAPVEEVLAAGEPLFLCWDDEWTHFALSDGKKAACFSAKEQAVLERVLKSGAAKAVTDSKQLYRQGLEWGMEPVGISFDAALAGYLLNPTASGYDLERLSAAYGAKNWSLPQVPGYEIPLERLARLMAVYEPMEKELAQNQQEYLLQQVEIPLARVLSQMEKDGFGIDRDELVAFVEEMAKRIDLLESEIYQLAGEEFNIASPKQLGSILFDKLGLPAGK